MARIAEGRGIPTHFGKENLQDPPADSGDGVESFQLLVVLFAALGTFAGILEFLYFTFTATPGMGGISLKLSLALAQIIAFLAGLLQILQILKIIR